MDNVLDYMYKNDNQTITHLAGINDHVFILDGVLTEHECDEIIKLSEHSGFKVAGLYTDEEGDTVVDTSTRQSMRCVFNSVNFACTLWNRIQHAIIKRLPIGLVAKRLNDCLRILKYKEGDFFAMHRDGRYMPPDMSEVSQYTVLIYLNDNYDGGFTTYYNSPNDVGVPIIPKKGSVVIQHQGCLHSVPPLISGTKYVLRAEVMYGDS